MTNRINDGAFQTAAINSFIEGYNQKMAREKAGRRKALATGVITWGALSAYGWVRGLR